MDLDFACQNGDFKAVKYLVENGADVNREHIIYSPIEMVCAAHTVMAKDVIDFEKLTLREQLLRIQIYKKALTFLKRRN